MLKENPIAYDEVIEQDQDIENVEEVEQEEGRKDEAIEIPPIDSISAQKTKAFLKGFANTGAQPSAQASRVLANPPAANTMPRAG